MTTLVVHCKRSSYDTYIGRPSKWGNLFSHKSGTLAIYKVDTVEEAVASYAAWVQEQEELMADIESLKDEVLGCWCKPLHACEGHECWCKVSHPCHGDPLARLADGYVLL